MTYNPNIPQPNDDPTASQADLLGNFGKLNTDWAVNHIPLTSGGNNGFHKMVQFPNVLGSDPAVTGLQSALYPKIGPDSNPALFFKNAANVLQLTTLPVVTVGTNFGIKTPFGFTINVGTIASGVTSTTFAIPFVSQVYTAELTPQNSVISYVLTSVGLTGLTLATSSPAAYYYLAIGV